MTDRTDSTREAAPNGGMKIFILATADSPTLVGGTDTLTLDLDKVGIKNVLAVKGYVHTTDNSVMVADAGTTAVSSQTLTYTTELANDNKKRVVIVIGES